MSEKKASEHLANKEITKNSTPATSKIIDEELLAEHQHQQEHLKSNFRKRATTHNKIYCTFSVNPSTLTHFKANNKELQENEIDFKKLIAEKFEETNIFKVKKTTILPNQDYLTDDIVKAINLDESNTVLLNVGLGSGKSTAILKIIKELIKDNRNIIISATPFKTLVKKEYKYLTSTRKDQTKIEPIDADLIFDYRSFDDADLESIDFDEFVNTNKCKPVQLITVNFLLSNPGENAFLQSRQKRNYLYELKKHCRLNKLKIYFILDELHESVHNFKSALGYNWRLWKKETHKVIVSTATYTESAFVVAKHLAFNTSDRIHIIEAERTKKTDQANLKLYFCKENYSSNNITELDYISYVAEQNIEENFKYNNIQVLSYSKKLAKVIANQSCWLDYNINLTISDNKKKVEFDRAFSNIGTTFKTGVNIEKTDLLIIVLPPTFSNGFKQKGEEGIFHDGLPSILQSVARMRGAGDIIVFIPPIKHLLEDSNNIFLGSPLADLVEDAAIESYSSVNDEIKPLQNIYDTLIKQVKEPLENDPKEEGRPEIQHPTFDNFVLEQGQGYLVYSSLSSGKYAYPLLLHYALTDQFTNCTLTECITHEYILKQLVLTAEDYKNNLFEYFKELYDLEKHREDWLLEDWVEYLKNNLIAYKNGTSEKQKLKIIDKGVEVENNYKFVSIAKNFNLICAYANSVLKGYAFYNKENHLYFRLYYNRNFCKNKKLEQAYTYLTYFIDGLRLVANWKYGGYLPKRNFRTNGLVSDNETKNLIKNMEYINSTDFYFNSTNTKLITRKIAEHKSINKFKYEESIYNAFLKLIFTFDNNDSIKNVKTNGKVFYKIDNFLFETTSKGIIKDIKWDINQ